MKRTLNLRATTYISAKPHSKESRGNDDVHEGEGGGCVWLAASVQPAKQK